MAAENVPTLQLSDEARKRFREEIEQIRRTVRDPAHRQDAINRAIAKLKRENPDAFRCATRPLKR